jgi:hypothetical protein
MGASEIAHQITACFDDQQRCSHIHETAVWCSTLDFAKIFLSTVCYRCHVLHAWAHNQQKEPVSAMECWARLSNMAPSAVQVISLCTCYQFVSRRETCGLQNTVIQQTEHLSRDKPTSIHSFCGLYYDRSIASCKASSPQGAIQRLLLQFPV